MSRRSPRVEILDAESGLVLFASGNYARRFDQRLIGLMFRRKYPPDSALIFERCRAVHTCFMSMPIDVLFIDPGLVVRSISALLPPWRSASCGAAAMVVEVAAGACLQSGLRVGSALLFRHVFAE